MSISESDDIYDCVIIGGGASGLACAISTARTYPKANILVMDRNPELGRKILASGNGKCNIDNVNAMHFEDVTTFFKSLGVIFTEPDSDGRVYPLSRQASTIRDACSKELQRLGVKIKLCAEVKAVRIVDSSTTYEIDIHDIAYIKKGKGEKERFVKADVQGEETLYQIRTQAIVIATGGKAGPQFGCLGDGLDFAKSLGLEIIHTQPALCPLIYDDRSYNNYEKLAGVRAMGQVNLVRDGHVIYTEFGEIQFTKSGISGICIFNVSNRYQQGDKLVLDLAPSMTEPAIGALLKDKKVAGLEGIVHARVAALIYDMIGSKKAYEPLAKLVKSITIGIKGTSGWGDAQVTRGGVQMSEVLSDTFESVHHKGLYILGETLDYAGDSGGYNLDFAIYSGIVAGCHILKKDNKC
ncbi:MAG: NAD(P)/FAD-dependent oxidoreductase [Clostridiales Family XIII bacterium]|jgi:predicted flavoprotein YhiN|nr:NAD(P)/FAD-dependent oxidoreductase [Clostridiales Family XIII bacterium]